MNDDTPSRKLWSAADWRAWVTQLVRLQFGCSPEELVGDVHLGRRHGPMVELALVAIRLSRLSEVPEC